MQDGGKREKSNVIVTCDIMLNSNSKFKTRK